MLPAVRPVAHAFAKALSGSVDVSTDGVSKAVSAAEKFAAYVHYGTAYGSMGVFRRSRGEYCSGQYGHFQAVSHGNRFVHELKYRHGVAVRSIYNAAAHSEIT